MMVWRLSKHDHSSVTRKFAYRNFLWWDSIAETSGEFLPGQLGPHAVDVAQQGLGQKLKLFKAVQPKRKNMKNATKNAKIQIDINVLPDF